MNKIQVQVNIIENKKLDSSAFWVAVFIFAALAGRDGVRGTVLSLVQAGELRRVGFAFGCFKLPQPSEPEKQLARDSQSPRQPSVIRDIRV